MSRRRRSLGCWLPIVLILAALGCLAAILLAGTATRSLGPSSPRLSPPAKAILAAYLLANRPGLAGPSGEPAASMTLDIEPGQNAQSVADQLAAAGIVDRPGLMTRYLTYRGLDTEIEAGRYEVNGAMSILELAELLQQARTSRYTITIPEGWRREEVAEALGRMGLGFTAGGFLQASRVAPPDRSQAPAYADDLEGFLFPDTYQLDPSQSADEVAQRMVETFETRVNDDLRAGFAAHGLTTYEAVSLASIVEREAVLASERPLIASVFLNRLALGIPLQADPTVQYALGRQADGWWKAPLSAQDLQIDSPYNTYLHDGLPPGPIASPGLSSLESVAHPADTAYLFFRTACDGSGRHTFAATFEEHLANACP